MQPHLQPNLALKIGAEMVWYSVFSTPHQLLYNFSQYENASRCKLRYMVYLFPLHLGTDLFVCAGWCGCKRWQNKEKSALHHNGR